ncbi:hypothetical protein H0H87_000296 [Tephrocybe sp. NHM501043]|nr:hypothetical protein H0H87_000296 [Tephrocybe sp. NHM501043]
MRRPTNSPKFYGPLSHSTSVAAAPVIPPTAATAPNDENAVPASKSPPPLPSTKESRAVEHDRQRLKKAAALLQRKARKAQLPGQHMQTKTHQTGSMRGPGVRIDDDEPGIEETEVEWGGATSPVRTKEGTAPSATRTEVPLSDLLIARKPRHGRASDRDFEVVPALRSVIVLDDFTLPELDPDEAWEHVYASDADDTTSAPSYAKIAALN